MKYYCIKQHDITDCGAACLATICRHNGYKIGISKIREVAGTGAGLGYLATRLFYKIRRGKIWKDYCYFVVYG